MPPEEGEQGEELEMEQSMYPPPMMAPNEDDEEQAGDYAEKVPEESEDDDDDVEKTKKQDATFFSDEKGNLKFVNFVVRRPCGIFWSILGLCILINFLFYC